MALIKCPECGREISDKASSCPGCGLPSKHFKSKNIKARPSKKGDLESVSSLSDIIDSFDELNQKLVNNEHFKIAINRVYELFLERSMTVFRYKSGFVGFINNIRDRGHRVYAGIVSIPEDIACVIRIGMPNGIFFSYRCKTAADAEKYMPIALTSLGFNPDDLLRGNSIELQQNADIDHSAVKDPPKIDQEVDQCRSSSMQLKIPDQYVSESEYGKYFRDIEKAKTQIGEHNRQWIQKQLIDQKAYLDSILSRIDPQIKLDEEQRRAILTDEDHALIVAGAGAGKTTTMAAKVKYLVDRIGIKPERILVISFTNKAVDELRDRINRRLGIPAIISTFHRFGYDIIKKANSNTPSIHVHPASIISDYLETMILNSGSLLKKILLFFSYYFDVTDDALNFDTLEQYHQFKASQDLQTLKSNLNEYNRKVMDNRTKAMRTCRGEYLRSYQEVQIANFLYMNCLEYEYERHYEHPLPELTKPYTPDFHIRQGEISAYLEHFGIHENGQSTIYTPQQLTRYQSRISDKRKIHQRYGTTLLETFSSYNDGRPIIDHLRDVLIKAGFTLQERDREEIYKKIIETSRDKYFYRFVDFVALFISRFKTKGFGVDKFEEFRKSSDNVRTLLFIDIVEEVYLAYQEELQNRNCLDFDDMINEAEKILDWLKSQGRKLPFDYVIVDEYQDISLQRFNLAKRITEVTDAKIVAVGDDWQSIFAFAGSDITLFTRFLKIMGSGVELQITHTYRNSQELIDSAGSFIQKNRLQIKKQLISPKRLDHPIMVALYNDTEKVLENKIKALITAIGELVQEFGSQTDILMIGRYNFELYQLTKSEHFYTKSDTQLICRKYPQTPLTFLTAHSSKGLGFDNVILLNAVDHRFGFPCQIDDDPILKFVVHQDKTIPFAEERRLFYVAMTRTKNRLIVLAPKTRPSRFLVELINEHGVQCDELSAVNFDDTWKLGLRCPQCGFPLRFEPFKTSIGLPLYICTNEPEICDFMTNSREQLSDIRKCDKCSDGYLIVKPRKKDRHYFYGCTNFRLDGSGCMNAMEITI